MTRTVDMVFPHHWLTAPTLAMQVELALDDGRAVIARAMLEDGTNLVALLHPFGQWSLRIDQNGLDEHRRGGPPPADLREPITSAWRTVVESSVRAKRDVAVALTGITTARTVLDYIKTVEEMAESGALV